jgi:hypothetical protein
MRMAIWASVLMACAHPHDVAARYAAVGDGPTGGIEVLLNAPSGALTVTVDGHVMVDRRFSRRAVIDAVPAGPAEVHVATGGRCEAGTDRTVHVDVKPGELTTVALPGPEPNHGCAVNAGLTAVAMALLGIEVALLDIGMVMAQHAPHFGMK